ncbi:MAG TPA: DnaA/Hda family protein [Pirellulales bacterium]|jgi:chromosomal replication initiator protein|nr:DnaA/Hda family protein [Pirellulales bacterium]
MSKDVLPTVLALLAKQLGQERYELWFGANTRLTLHDNTLLVEASSQFLQDWLRQHYRCILETACREALANDAAKVEFRMDEQLAAKSTPIASPPADQTPSHNGPASIPVLGLENPLREVSRSGKNSPIKKVCPSNNGFSIAPHANGLPAVAEHEPLPRRRFATLPAFVVGGANRLAHASAQMIAERPGSLNPLLLYGPHGSGKTHLLEGIWTAARGQVRGRNCVYLSAEQFTTFYVAASRGGGMPSFRRKYRTVDVLLIDDLQFFAGKKGTLVELLHTIDTALREGRQLVFAADRPPAELTGLGTELSSRLASGMVCSLEAPDQSMRCLLAQEFGRRLGIELPAPVAEFVAAQVTPGAREISGAVNRLHAASRLLECAIDHAFAEETLADILRHSGRTVRLVDIERAVCDVFSLPKESLQSPRRAKPVSTARMLAMWLARKYTRAGLSEIGEYFGRRSHSTVISAHKRVTGWIDGQSEIELAHARCKVDEALRRVEAQLRTG